MPIIPEREPDKPFDMIYRWNPTWMKPTDRKGQRCRCLVRGTKNSILLEFEDGFKMVTSGWCCRPAPPDEQPSIFT